MTLTCDGETSGVSCGTARSYYTDKVSRGTARSYYKDDTDYEENNRPPVRKQAKLATEIGNELKSSMDLLVVIPMLLMIVFLKQYLMRREILVSNY